MATGGPFTHKTIVEGEELLDRILENTPPLEPIWFEPEPVIEEVSLAVAKSIIPIERPSPKLETHDEDSQCMELLAFEDDLFEEFRNTLEYACKRRPPIPITPDDPLD